MKKLIVLFFLLGILIGAVLFAIFGTQKHEIVIPNDNTVLGKITWATNDAVVEMKKINDRIDKTRNDFLKKLEKENNAEKQAIIDETLNKLKPVFERGSIEVPFEQTVKTSLFTISRIQITGVEWNKKDPAPKAVVKINIIPKVEKTLLGKIILDFKDKEGITIDKYELSLEELDDKSIVKPCIDLGKVKSLDKIIIQ